MGSRLGDRPAPYVSGSVRFEAGVDVLNGAAYLDPGWNANCPAGHWWVCGDGVINGSDSDPLALFDITQPVNMESGKVSGWEGSWQHFFSGTPFGVTMNYTKVNGGNVEPDLLTVGRQFVLPGLGDSGNASVFFENPKHTIRLALNYRAETASGFAIMSSLFLWKQEGKWIFHTSIDTTITSRFFLMLRTSSTKKRDFCQIP